MLKFDQEFLEAAAMRQEPEYFVFKRKAKPGNFEWKDFEKILAELPSEHVKHTKSRKRILATGVESNKLVHRPKVIVEGIEILKELYPYNPITAHIFSGYANDSKSFGIHRDGMHVLYVQLFGTINWSVWQPLEEDPKEKIEPENGKILHSAVMKPGDMIFVRAGTYHYIEPLEPRIGVSFGVEGLKK